VRFEFELVGDARAEIAAVGPGDAEHQIEKLVRASCPECGVQVIEIRRQRPDPRIADEYEVAYRIRFAGEIEAESASVARRGVLRSARQRFADTIAWAAVWSEPKLREGSDRSNG
jgi:hypothetical protein